jgi:hypothetical protein
VGRGLGRGRRAAIEDYLEKHLAFLDFLEDAAASS